MPLKFAAMRKKKTFEWTKHRRHAQRQLHGQLSFTLKPWPVQLIFLSSPHNVVSREHRLTELCPKECVRFLETTRSKHLYECTQTYTHTQAPPHINLHNPFLCPHMILFLCVHRSPSSKPRWGTFGSSVSGKKKNETRKKEKKENVKHHKCWLFPLYIFFCLFPPSKLQSQFLEFSLGLKRHSKFTSST